MSLIRAHTSNMDLGWPYDAMRGWPPELVQKYCVQDEEWQGIRLSMKGEPTHKKLKILGAYAARKITHLNTSFVRKDIDERFWCQVDNYLGALRRGGQLDDNNMIKKWI